jgi:hypothetical protein
MQKGCLPDTFVRLTLQFLTYRQLTLAQLKIIFGLLDNSGKTTTFAGTIPIIKE